MDIIRFYQDHGIQYAEEGQSHHASPGWVQINCPFCDDPSDHLGYNLRGDYFNCWRCGWHSTDDTIGKLLGIPEQEARSIIRQYGGHSGRSVPQPSLSSTAIHDRGGQLAGGTECPLPVGTSALTLRHKAYLHARGYDPGEVEEKWGLLGTGPVAPLTYTNREGAKVELDYKHRIIAPIYWHGKMVSFQARDITGRQEPKYLFCPPELELIPNKNLLYGSKQKAWKRTGICVEGITDVWRFGPIAFATFGTSFTETQIYLMVQFEKVIIVFDPEPEAQKKAEKLKFELIFRGVVAHIITPNKDPGGMTQEEAERFLARVLE